MHTQTHTYTHLHTPTHTYTRLSTPTHTYAHLRTPTHTYADIVDILNGLHFLIYFTSMDCNECNRNICVQIQYIVHVFRRLCGNIVHTMFAIDMLQTRY